MSTLSPSASVARCTGRHDLGRRSAGPPCVVELASPVATAIGRRQRRRSDDGDVGLVDPERPLRVSRVERSGRLDPRPGRQERQDHGRIEVQRDPGRCRPRRTPSGPIRAIRAGSSGRPRRSPSASSGSARAVDDRRDGWWFRGRRGRRDGRRCPDRRRRGVGAGVGAGVGVGRRGRCRRRDGLLPGPAAPPSPAASARAFATKSAALSFVSMPFPAAPPGARSRLEPAGGAAAGRPLDEPARGVAPARPNR